MDIVVNRFRTFGAEIVAIQEIECGDNNNKLLMADIK